MKLSKPLAALVLPLALLMSGVSNAEMIFPAVEIDILGDDDGLILTGSGLTIDGSATGIIDVHNDFTAFDTVQTFILTATGTHSIFTPPAPGAPEMINGTFDGTFSIGEDLLTGTFTGLSLSGLSVSPSLAGDLVYTGGSLAGSLTTGRLELATAGSNVQGKLGPVVPVPAAVWLFGSGLIGLAGVARRKT